MDEVSSTIRSHLVAEVFLFGRSGCHDQIVSLGAGIFRRWRKGLGNELDYEVLHPGIHHFSLAASMLASRPTACGMSRDLVLPNPRMNP